jgi:hypothetical protein
MASCGVQPGLGRLPRGIVAFVDDDAVPSETWLEGMVRTFGRDEQIVAVGGRDMVVGDGQVIEAERPRILARISGARRYGIGRDQLGGKAMFAAAQNEALAILDHFWSAPTRRVPLSPRGA